MSYCIKPNCSNPQNPDDYEYCQDCGTKLLINDRYQIIRPLRAGSAYNSEVFEVRDLNEQGKLKVLKCLAVRHKNSKFAELFEKEAQVLIWLSSVWQMHPGIPKVKPDGYFTFSISNGFRKVSCLVMEKIEGQNLEEWIEENQPISQEQALNWLQQIVEILDKVHRQGLWHRDIKPSNIMLKPDGNLVLIDFGAVGVGETRINSYGYTPPEQIQGETVPQSDFFALGRTFVYLLTGRHPCELPISATKQLIWRNLAPTISNNLARLLDDLMAPAPANRPQNPQEIQRRLIPPHETHQTRKIFVKVLWVSGATLLLGLVGTIIYEVLPCQVLGTFKLCPAARGDHLSFGEEILTPRSETPEKQKGVDAFRDGKYKKAVDWLNKAWNSDLVKRDPETLIYLNNARIEAQHTQSYTIAVAVPLDTNPLDSSLEGFYPGLEILRGVAQAQDEFNRRSNKAGLKVLIADDANNSAQARKIAEVLVNQKEVLAVVGHYTSDSTLEEADIYQKNKLVFISPTSTSEDLSALGNHYNPNFFFRTVPSDRFTAQALTQYLNQQANQQTAAVFYNSSSKYSNSLLKQFSSSFNVTGGKVIDEPLSSITPRQAIDQAARKGAKVLALFPNTQRGTLNQTLNLINANECTYPMIGGDTVYNPEILQGVSKKAATCLVVAVPWHSKDSSNTEFPQEAEKLWAGTVSWRTALAYDATRTLIEAIKQSKINGKTLQQVLAAPNFKATGATGVIQFQANGDRNENESKSTIKLVKLAVDKQGNFMFSPLNTTP